MATTVTLLKKFISENKISCYLSFYPPILDPNTGKQTRRDFLHLYLISDIETRTENYIDKNGKQQKRILPVLNKNNQPKLRKLSDSDKQYNAETWDTAKMIRNKKQLEIDTQSKFPNLVKESLKSSQTSNEDFVEYFKVLADKKRTENNWTIVYNYLYEFTEGKLSFNELDEKFCENFKDYILNIKAYNSDEVISQNSACTYYVKFKCAVKQAYKDKKISTNIGASISPIKLLETQRNFLTLAELNRLVKTSCYDPVLKKAALVSCLTGLRKSDLLKLTWGEIEIIDKKPVIRFRQQKTKGVETLWISDQAYQLLGKRGKPEDKVFPGLKITSYNMKYFFRWLGEAKIDKPICFHSMRHTFATLQLANGTDIYTLSKLLGHKNVKTTAIYGKVIDKSRQDAANRIKLNFKISDL
jgi:integrase